MALKTTTCSHLMLRLKGYMSSPDDDYRVDQGFNTANPGNGFGNTAVTDIKFATNSNQIGFMSSGNFDTTIPKDVNMDQRSVDVVEDYELEVWGGRKNYESDMETGHASSRSDA